MFQKLIGFTYNLSFASSSLASFTANLISGGPVIQGFIGQIENLGKSALDYSIKAFDKASENEVNRLAAGGAISNSFSKKIDFNEGLNLFDEIKIKLAKSAASLPGTTSDYITVFRSLSDDMATALNSSTLGGKQLSQLFRDKVPQAVEKLVLQTKLYGQDIPVSSITKTYSKLLSTGKVNSREIFLQRNPVLRTSIEKWEKDNGKKLPSLNIRDRFEALNKIFGDSISTQQMQGLTDSFQAKVETFKSYVLDPDVGLFGFERKFKLKNKDTGAEEDKTMFQVLADAIGPVVEGLAQFAQNLILMGDPLKFLAETFNNTVGASLLKFASQMDTFNTYFQVTEGSFEDKLDAALKAAFNFDYKKFDYSGAVDRFFKSLISGIENLGKNLKPGDEFNETIKALLDGFVGTALAIAKRIMAQAAAYPVETFQFLLVTNPGVIFQGIIALLASLALFSPAITYVFSALASVTVGLVGALLGAVPIIGAIIAGILGLAAAILPVVAVIGGVVVFSKQLIGFGKDVQDFSKGFSGPYRYALESFGAMLIQLGKTGDRLKAAWDAFASGNWSGAVLELTKSIGHAFLAALKAIAAAGFGLAGGAASLWDSIKDPLWGLVTFLIKGIGDILMAIPNLIIAGLSKFFSVPDRVAATQSVPENDGSIGSKIKQSLNTAGKFYFPNSGLIFPNAEGNPLGNLLAAVRTESNMMPSGASLAIANSSEAIIPSDKAKAMLSNKNRVGNVNVTVNVAGATSSAFDIAAEVRKVLIQALDLEYA